MLLPAWAPSNFTCRLSELLKPHIRQVKAVGQMGPCLDSGIQGLQGFFRNVSVYEDLETGVWKLHRRFHSFPFHINLKP